jgi:rubrerythrin
MTSTTANEILQFSIRLEDVGERFYLDVANHSSDIGIKDLFNLLAAQEAQHKKVFEKLLSRVDEFQNPDSYPIEYLEYFYYYVDKSLFFTNEKKTPLSEAFNIQEVFDHAIEMELDSIMLYQEFKPFVPVEDNNIIESIIFEERGHFIKLSAAKKSLL